jgi:hypothetical protein
VELALPRAWQERPADVVDDAAAESEADDRSPARAALGVLRGLVHRH